MHQSTAEFRDTDSYSPNPKGAAQCPQGQAEPAPTWNLMLPDGKSWRDHKFFRGTASAASSPLSCGSVGAFQALSCSADGLFLCVCEGLGFFFFPFALIQPQSSGFLEYKEHGRMGPAGMWGCQRMWRGGGSLNWVGVQGALAGTE